MTDSGPVEQPPQPSPSPAWSPPSAPGGVPEKFCQACGRPLDARAEICPHCGARQAVVGTGAGKDRALAAALALLVGGLGIHKFYLGKVALGVLYLLLSWTGIPSFIGWLEGISYLLKSDEAWAAQYGGPPQRTSGAAIGCLWILALVPLLSMVAIVAIVTLIFLGSQVSVGV